MTDYRPIEQPFNERPPLTFGPYLPTVVPQSDVMRRDRLPSSEGMELEYRESPSTATDGIFFETVAFSLLFLVFVLNSLVIGPIARILGSSITSILYLPVWVGLAWFFSRARIRRTEQGGALTATILAALLLPFFMKTNYAEPPKSPSRLAVAFLVICVVGFAADSIATHYCYFMTANPRLRSGAVRRRRAWWGARLNPVDVMVKARQLREKLQESSEKDQEFEANAIRLQLRESWAMAQYGVGFLFLPLAAFVLIFSVSREVQVLLLLVSFLWAYRNPKIMPAPDIFVFRVIFPALRSWLCWGRWEASDGVATPGVFVSPRGTSGERILVTALACWGCAAIFVPPISTWGHGNPLTKFWIGTFLVDLLTYAVLPALVVIAAFVAVAGSALGAYYMAIEDADAPETRERRSFSDWECYARKLAESEHDLEREHLWLGVQKEARYPILVHEKILAQHAHILGPTGGGKTTLGYTPLLRQRIMRRNAGIVFVDLKGDMSMMEEVRISAEENGIKFKYFTNELGYPTYTFNPMAEINIDTVSLSQVAETLMEALRLDHGQGYGERFFASQSREFLLNTLKRFPNIKTFADLYEKTANEFFDRKEDRDRCKELISVLQQVAEVQPLNWKGDEGESPSVAENAIVMSDVVEKNEIAYFWLPAIGETATVRELANLVLSTLIIACKKYRRLHGKSKQTYVFMDEFQRMASSSFELILQQARSYGVSAILANQTLTDLKTKDAPNLLSTTLNNTSFRQFFSPCDPNVEDLLIEQSGETVHTNLFYSELEREDLDPALQTITKPFLDITVGNRWNRNDLKSYSSELTTSIVLIPRDSGYTCYGGHPFAVETDFHIDVKTYEERLNAKWPLGNEHTIVACRKAVKQANSQTQVRILTNTAIVPGIAAAGDKQKGEGTLLSFPAPDAQRWYLRLKATYEKRLDHV